MTPEEAATRYIAHGWSVFPVGGDKHPLIKWGHLRERYPSEAEVQAWFARWAHAGLAIVTGRFSRLVVLDIDPGHGGDATLAKLIKQKVIAKGDLETARVTTQSGGTHYYFRYPDDTEIVPSARGLWPGVDIRADDGYVVAPPTLGETGNAYTWVETIDTVGLQNVPDKLLEELAKRAQKHQLTDIEKSALMAPQGAGTRHEAMVKLIGHFAAIGETRATSWRIINLWNEHNDPPVEEEELRHQFDDMWARWAPEEVATSLDETLAKVREVPEEDRKTLLMNVLEGRRLHRTEHVKYREMVHDEFGFPKGVFDVLVTKTKGEAPEEAPETVESVEVVGERRESAIDLLKAPDLLHRVLRMIQRQGLVGEEANALLCYLSASSRFLEDPINIRLEGESSSGKSAIMLKALDLIPEEEKIVKHGFSPQAIIYTDLVFRHKVVCLLEMDGNERTGFNIRVLQSEKAIEFDVTTKAVDGQGFTTQTYRKEGPAAWFTSTVRITDDVQNTSRTWPITPDSSPEQTWRVALAQTMRRPAVPEAEMELFFDAQRLLAGGESVTVAYPTDIHQAVDDVIKMKNPRPQTTFRRDNERIRDIIRASAFLHQYQREFVDGEIIPDIRDYYFAWRASRQALDRSMNPAMADERIRDTYFAVCEIFTEKADSALNKEIVEKMREKGYTNAYTTMETWIYKAADAGVIAKVRHGQWQPIVAVSAGLIESPELLPDPSLIAEALEEKHPEWKGLVFYDPLDGSELRIS